VHACVDQLNNVYENLLYKAKHWVGTDKCYAFSIY
jgi:hypothetical protein